MTDNYDGYFPNPPEKAKGTGIGDVELSFKYKINDTSALALAYKGGLLKAGNGPQQISDVSDGHEELSTGYKADFTSFALYKDISVKNHIISATAAYAHSSRGYEFTLDNNYATDPGDTFSFQVESTFNPHEKLALKPSFTYVQTGYDEKKEAAGNWDEIDGSESAATIYGIRATYEPAIFLNLWLDYSKTKNEKVARGNYEYPGRLFIDNFVSFGITLFYQ